MNKITGYILVGVGVMVMFFSLFSMYKVFVDRKPVAPVVQLADMNLRSQMGNMVIPMDNLNTLANIGLFAVLMMFVLAVGGKIAALGCNLIKIERIHDALLQLDNKQQIAEPKTLKKL